jgi:allantoate deiminase
MARHLPTAMLFVPSVEGRSHSPAEYTTPADAVRGASVLATALYGGPNIFTPRFPR